MAKITIKQTTDMNDLVLLRLQKEALPGDYPVPPDGRTLFWIAYVNGTPAGFCSLTPLKKDKSTGHLSRAGVLKAYRGMGIQKKLINVRATYAKKQKWKMLITDTLCSNAASINSLIACGFRAYFPASPWMAPGACYWRKRL